MESPPPHRHLTLLLLWACVDQGSIIPEPTAEPQLGVEVTAGCELDHWFMSDGIVRVLSSNASASTTTVELPTILVLTGPTQSWTVLETEPGLVRQVWHTQPDAHIDAPVPTSHLDAPSVADWRERDTRELERVAEEQGITVASFHSCAEDGGDTWTIAGRSEPNALNGVPECSESTTPPPDPALLSACPSLQEESVVCLTDAGGWSLVGSSGARCPLEASRPLPEAGGFSALWSGSSAIRCSDLLRLERIDLTTGAAEDGVAYCTDVGRYDDGLMLLESPDRAGVLRWFPTFGDAQCGRAELQLDTFDEAHMTVVGRTLFSGTPSDPERITRWRLPGLVERTPLRVEGAVKIRGISGVDDEVVVLYEDAVGARLQVVDGDDVVVSDVSLDTRARGLDCIRP